MDASTWSQLQSLFGTYWYVWFSAGLIPGIIYGIFTAKLAKKKGYRGYFFTGFFFNVIGLIYVVGLPLSRDRQD